MKRDHKAEWAQWEGWLDHIATSVKRVGGVTTKVNQPSADLSNRTPELQIQWDGAKLGITGQEVGKMLLDTEPRIVVARSSGARPGNMASTVAIVPYQMMPGDEKVVADRLYALLSKPPKIENPPPPPSGPPLFAPPVQHPGPASQEAYPVYGEAPQDPPTMITSPLPSVPPGVVPAGPPGSVPPAIVPQAADSALPRRVRGSTPGPVWPPAGTLTAAVSPVPQQDAVAVREALEDYEAGVERALRDSAEDLPSRRRSGPRHAGPATAAGAEDALPPEDTRRTTP